MSRQRSVREASTQWLVDHFDDTAPQRLGKPAHLHISTDLSSRRRGQDADAAPAMHFPRQERARRGVESRGPATNDGGCVHVVVAVWQTTGCGPDLRVGELSDH